MPIQNAMLRHTLLLSLASVWMRGVSMLFQVWLSNRLGAAGVGLLQLILTVGMLAATVGAAGVRVASMYLVAEERGKRRPEGIRQAMSRCLIYGGILSSAAAVALYFAAPTIGEKWIADSDAVGALQLLALFLPAGCLCAVLSGWFTACVKIRQLTRIEVVGQLGTLALAALFLSMAGSDRAASCRAVVLANGLGEVGLLCVLLPCYLRSQRGIASQPAPGMWRRLLRLSLPLAGSEILRSGLSTAEHLMIPRGLAASGANRDAAMASYGTIHGMVFPVMMFPATLLYALSDLLVPELARCSAAGSTQRIRYLTGRCLKLGVIFACAVSGTLFCAAQPLGMLLYQSTEAARYLRLFAPLAAMLYLDALVDAMLKGLGQQVASVRYNILTSALDVALLLLLLPRYGIDGYFWSFVLTHGINFCLSARRLTKVTGHGLDAVFCLKTMLCTALCTFSAHLVVRQFTSLPALLAGCICYLLVLGFLLTVCGALSRSELRWLRQLFYSRSAHSSGES